MPRANRSLAKELAHQPGLDKLAYWLDSAFRIPGTNFRFGLDAIMGLVPFGGDVVSGVLQSGMVLTAMADDRVPKKVVAKMTRNVILDMTVGSIPVIGDLFDFGFRSASRNIKLLRGAQAAAEN